MRLSKNMTAGERATLVADFRSTFRGEDVVTVEGLTNWALNTQFWFNWFYDRFARAAAKSVEQKRFYKYFLSYRPYCMEWAAHEIIPTTFADSLRGLSKGFAIPPAAEHKAAWEIFKYFRNKFVEESGIVIPNKWNDAQFHQFTEKELVK